MALAYPEGECFFKRSGLVMSGGYNANTQSDFYKHMLVEFIWNVEAHHGEKNSKYPSGHTHPRSGYNISKGSNWGTRYGNWTQLPFSYGPTETTITRRVQHNLCTNGNRFKNYEKGGSAEAWFMTVPMPTTTERWVWIDLLAPIRAVYLPLAYMADQQHPDLCAFVQVNFATGRNVSMWRGGNNFGTERHNLTFGLEWWSDWVLGLDVTGLIELLSIPRQLRKSNPYEAKLIKMVDRTKNTFKTVPVSQSFSDSKDFNLTKIIAANSGLELQWKPPQNNSWTLGFLKNILTIAAGFIPGVGPLAAFMFTMVWTAAFDPDAVLAELKKQIPLLDLTDHLANELKKGMNETKSLMAPGLVPSKPSAIQWAPEATEAQSEQQIRTLEEIGPDAAFSLRENVFKSDALVRVTMIRDGEVEDYGEEDGTTEEETLVENGPTE